MKLLTVIAVSIAIAMTTIPTGGSAPTQRRTGLIRVFAITQRNVVDGRMQLLVKRVRDRHARPIGDIGQVCTRLPRTSFGSKQSCVGTLVMPLGRIMFQGVRRSAGYYVLAVTGGTGAYAGATGSMAARTISTGPRVEWLLVSLV